MVYPGLNSVAVTVQWQIVLAFCRRPRVPYLVSPRGLLMDPLRDYYDLSFLSSTSSSLNDVERCALTLLPIIYNQMYMIVQVKMGVFPQELFDYIIDILKDDDTALSACSLVRSSWTHSARRHLFRHLLHSAVNRAPDFLDLSGFLRSSPRICSYIRTLHLYGGIDPCSAGIDLNISGDIIHSLQFLEDLHLESLSLCPHEGTPPDTGTNLPNCRPRANRKALRNLHLRRVYYLGKGNFHTLCSFFQTISTVHHLTIEGIHSYGHDVVFYNNDYSLEKLDLPRGLDVYSLTMLDHSASTRFFLTTFLQAQPSTIRNLRLETLSPDLPDLAPLMDSMMLGSIGSGLQDLTIDVGREGGEICH